MENKFNIFEIMIKELNKLGAKDIQIIADDPQDQETSNQLAKLYNLKFRELNEGKQ